MRLMLALTVTCLLKHSPIPVLKCTDKEAYQLKSYCLRQAIVVDVPGIPPSSWLRLSRITRPKPKRHISYKRFSSSRRG